MPLCRIKSFHNKHNKHNHQARPRSSDDSDDCETEAQRVEVSLRRNLPSIIITGLVTNLVSKSKPSSFYIKELHIPIEILIMITIATSGTVVEITSGAVGICRQDPIQAQRRNLAGTRSGKTLLRVVWVKTKFCCLHEA